MRNLIHILTLFSLVACVLLVADGTRVSAKTRSPGPNIVLIVADDLGYAELGCFGQQRIQTPRLDQLAAQGMRLTSHYAGNAVCAPSRCVLMIGRHPGHAPIRDNREVKPEGQQSLPADEWTLAELLRRHGYATGAFGKWGLGAPGAEGDPLNQGFDRFFGYNCQRHAHSYYPAYLWSDRERVALQNDPPVPGHAGLAPGADPQSRASYAPFQGDDYAPDRINEQALKFVREHQDRPFFLYYPTIIPHLALHVPDSELEEYQQLGWHDPPFVRRDSGYTPHFSPRAAYASMITHLDANVGRLLDLLDELKLADNTIVIFTSDNGTTHVKQEVDYEFFDSVDGLRGLKGSLYEGGVRVPAIVRWPGQIRPGSVSNYVSGFEDWFVTFGQLLGDADVDSLELDGVNLLPVLHEQPGPPRPFLYREFAGYGGQQSIRVGRWKAIRTGMNAGHRQVELYDLDADPGEQHDLADRHPSRVAELTALMEKQHQAQSGVSQTRHR